MYILIQLLKEQLSLVVTQCLFHASTTSDHAQLRPEDAIMLQFCVALAMWHHEIFVYTFFTHPVWLARIREEYILIPKLARFETLAQLKILITLGKLDIIHISSTLVRFVISSVLNLVSFWPFWFTWKFGEY